MAKTPKIEMPVTTPAAAAAPDPAEDAMRVALESAKAASSETKLLMDDLKAARKNADAVRTAAEVDVQKLSTFILNEVPGEPRENQGAVDTAIRVIRELSFELVQARAANTSACETVARMHAAALGEEGGGARRGVVEDVADLRAERDDLAAKASDLKAQLASIITAPASPHLMLTEITTAACADDHADHATFDATCPTCERALVVNVRRAPNT